MQTSIFAFEAIIYFFFTSTHCLSLAFFYIGILWSELFFFFLFFYIWWQFYVSPNKDIFFYSEWAHLLEKLKPVFRLFQQLCLSIRKLDVILFQKKNKYPRWPLIFLPSYLFYHCIWQSYFLRPHACYSSNKIIFTYSLLRTSIHDVTW